MEFMIVMLLLAFIVAGFGYIIRERLDEVETEDAHRSIVELARSVQHEIETANAMEPGYVRTFELPVEVNGLNYTVGLEQSFMIVKIGEKELSLAVQNATGVVSAGRNMIRKTSSGVFINQTA